MRLFENYQRQSYRNRAYILTSGGVYKIIIPIKNFHKKILMKDTEIDYTYNWINQHYKTFCTSYGKMPFFIYYNDKIFQILKKNYKYLLDLNMNLMYLFCNILGMDRDVSLTQKYSHKPGDDIVDLRNFLSIKKGCYKDRRIYKDVNYYQVLENSFSPNLSILDLIFSQGPNSLNILKESTFNFSSCPLK